MKKNVLRKDFFMEIRKSMGRFISIFFIVTLGVAFYSGIRASEPSMRVSGDSYFDKLDLMDIKVMGSMGLTKEDIQAMELVDGIELAEGAYSKDVLCPAGDTEKVVHILSVGKNFNTVQVKEGRLPQKEGECLLDEDFLLYDDYQIGDTITFRSGDENPLTDSLVTDTFTIVGIGNSPLYISFGRGNSLIGNGEVSGFVLTDESSFDMDVYTEAYVRVEGLKEKTAFTEEYAGLSDAAVSALEKIEEERCQIRRSEILAEADEEIFDAENTVNEESEKLDEARQELEEAKSTAARELEDARQALVEAREKLESSKRQIADGEAQLAEGKEELKKQQKTLEEAEIEYGNGAAKLSAKEEEWKEGQSKYLQEYHRYMPVISAGKEEIEKGKQQIAEGKKQAEEGIQTINAALEPLTALEGGLQAAEEGIAQLEGQISLIENSIVDGDTKYNAYSQIAEEDRTQEQKDFLSVWQEEKASLVGQKAVLEQKSQELIQQQAYLIQQMQGAGFADAAALGSQIAYLKTQKENAEEGLSELEKQEEKLLENERGLLEQEQKILAAGEELQQGRNQLDMAKEQLAEAKKQIDSGASQLNAAWKLIESKEQTLAEGKTELAKGQQEFLDGQDEYEKAAWDAAVQIADGEKQIADGEEQLTQAKQEIADAKAEIEKIENPRWYVQDRSEALAEYDGYGENADRMRSIGQVFPWLFFLVAALISLTSMTRMVEEQRVQIGTMKALGYGKFSIAKKYIYYALLATFGGSIIGVLLGEKIFPFIIIYAYKILYKHIPDILLPYDMGYAVQATAIAVLCTLTATIASCYKELAAQPANLMRPPAPKQGKRIFMERIGFIWRRLNFSWKSSVRNLVRYKKRFFMTVFGIGGCMALMVVGFGLKDCIYEIVSLQYEKVQFYDAAAYMNDDISGKERENILEYLKHTDAVDDFIQTRMQKVKVKSEASEESLYLQAPEDETHIEEFLSFHSRTKDETYSLEEDQVILTEKMSQLLDVGVGDTVTVIDEDRGNKDVKIGAVCENYMGHYLYMGNETYEELYGARPVYNGIIYQVKEGQESEIEKIGTDLLAFDDVLNVSYTSSIEGRLDDMLKSLNLVIVVLIVSAGMLAFVVLYNLNNINITERKRELATLKVLGFYDMEVAAYVYRENVMLTFIGALAGIVLGNILHRFTIVTVEVNEAMFGRQIHWQSYVYSFLFTVGFSIFVNMVMYFKLKVIDMIESLKSVE